MGASPPEANGNDGNGWGWQLLEGLLIFTSGDASSTRGFGDTARARVKTVLLIMGVGVAAIVALVMIAAAVH
ncbi:hypothetical protein A5779_19020 [Mycolicibacterium peregrinum]|uniref:Uncharacterized protein n=1 Tax=Mycolicibacterium peregrinum TaxID=43304 RepID=A0A1A0WBP8_MYCPR|nr:hypothetical protein A5779_19020 [Mycolicibacterium peregrinum]